MSVTHAAPPSAGDPRHADQMTTPVNNRGRRRRQGRRQWVGPTVLWVVAIALTAPFLALVIEGLTPGSELARSGWLPAHWRWANVGDSLAAIPFWQYAKNSLVISTILAGLTTFTSAAAGYAFARLRGPGKQLLFGVLVSMMIVPQIVTLIPTYLLFSKFGLVGNYWPWVLWGLAGAPYAIFLYRQFFAGFPRELEEAARLDGAGQIRTFWSIFLPLSRPMLVTAFILAFNATWGDFIAPNLLLSQDNTTLAVGIATGYVNDQGFPLPNLLAVAGLFYLVPVIVLFLVAQRSYVRGFVSSGIK